MKNIFLIFLLFLSIAINAQIAIGKKAISNNSVSLEFGNENRGLILPWVSTANNVTGAVDGTIIFDTQDKKIKVKSNGSWIDYTAATNGAVDVSRQDKLVENTNSKVKIGNNISDDATPGILVLTDNDKAMILPKVANPHLNIINPSAGMIVYDTINHQLVTFNGTVWSFWKPN